MDGNVTSLYADVQAPPPEPVKTALPSWVASVPTTISSAWEDSTEPRTPGLPPGHFLCKFHSDSSNLLAKLAQGERVTVNLLWKPETENPPILSVILEDGITKKGPLTPSSVSCRSTKKELEFTLSFQNDSDNCSDTFTITFLTEPEFETFVSLYTKGACHLKLKHIDNLAKEQTSLDCHAVTYHFTHVVGRGLNLKLQNILSCRNNLNYWIKFCRAPTDPPIVSFMVDLTKLLDKWEPKDSVPRTMLAKVLSPENMKKSIDEKIKNWEILKENWKKFLKNPECQSGRIDKFVSRFQSFSWTPNTTQAEKDCRAYFEKGVSEATQLRSILEYFFEKQDSEQWVNMKVFAQGTITSLQNEMTAIQRDYGDRSDGDKRRMLQARVIWVQYKYAFMYFTQTKNSDIWKVIFAHCFQIIQKLTSMEPFRDRTMKLPASIPIEKVAEYFNTRLNHRAPINHVNQWLFHWCGFNESNWRERNCDLHVTYKLLFLKNLVDDRAFFFGFSPEDAEKHLEKKKTGTFMLRLSSTQAGAIAVTQRVSSRLRPAVASHFRMTMIGGFLLDVDGWSENGYPVIKVDDFVTGKINRGTLRKPMRTVQSSPMYNDHYVAKNGNQP